MKNENDKYKKAAAREAAQEESETEFLDGTALKDDLTEANPKIDNHGVIVDSEHPENQEWHAREKQNQDNQEGLRH